MTLNNGYFGLVWADGNRSCTESQELKEKEKQNSVPQTGKEGSKKKKERDPNKTGGIFADGDERKSIYTWEFDATGEEIFSHGPAGLAHVLSHHYTDTGDCVAGYSALTKLLEVAGPDTEVSANSVSNNSDWAHVYFHLCVFELALNKVDDAMHHFAEYILPLTDSDDVVTDGPAMLWRLLLTKPDLNLDWNKLRVQALRNESKDHSAFQELHDMLTFCGAGDKDILAKEIGNPSQELRPPRPSTEFILPPRATPEQKSTIQNNVVNEYGQGLLMMIECEFKRALMHFEASLPHFDILGCSQAQKGLFVKIRDRAAQDKCLNPQHVEKALKNRKKLELFQSELSSTRFQRISKYLKRWMKRLQRRVHDKKRLAPLTWS